MEYEGQAQSKLYPSAPTADTYPPPYATFQSPPPGGMPYPQAPPQLPAYSQPYPSATPHQPYGQDGYPCAGQQPYGHAGYPSAEFGPPPAYGYPAPGSAVYGKPQVGPQQMVLLSPQPQIVVVAPPNSVSMIGAIILSCFVFWCCVCPIGLVAFILALVGQNTSSRGNAQSAIQLRNASYGVSCVGIIIGIVVTVVFFMLRSQSHL